VQISEEATAVHGITAEDLYNEPAFSEKASEVLAFMEGCDLGGYNLSRFDIPMLFEECYRAGHLHNFKKHRVIDVFSIWSTYEPRTLTGAVKRFLGADHDHAHEAIADVRATATVFEKQLEAYHSQYETLDDIITATTASPNSIDFSGKFEKTEDGVIITFGKHKGKTVNTVYLEDEGYLRWMYEKADFPTDTKLIARKLYGSLSEKHNVNNL
jgi:DNA polymerase-3 subunit epsilon